MKRLFSALLFTAALALPGAISAKDAEPLQVTLQQEAAQYAEPFYSAYITAGENRFTFIVPQGFHLKDDPASGKLSLGNRDGDCSLSFSIIASAPTEDDPVTTDSCRALLLKKYPGGKILQEFSTGVAGRSGPSFDIQWKATEHIYQCARIAFIPTAYGVFMFSATSGRSQFPATQGYFGLITGTFCASRDGKFNPVHIQPTS